MKQSEVNKKRQARAPYNFVPLPDTVVLAQDPPAQDVYHTEIGKSKVYTGRIECSMTTMSPLYTRAAMTPEFFQKWADDMDKLHTDQVDREAYAQFFHLEDSQSPVIPGSSLRGMVRSLMEIVCHSHMRWVADKPTFTFRAVADKTDDPLREPYQKVLGKLGSNVRAGYLQKEDNRWFIQPAKTPSEMGWPLRKDAYLKVKERNIVNHHIPDFQDLNSPQYEPAWHKVSFDAEVRRGSKAKYVALTEIGPEDQNLKHIGTLVCSGNMLETAGHTQESPRFNHALVLEKNTDAKRIPIAEQAVKDYRAGMSRFQKESLDAWGGKEWGCLKKDAPVFYVEPKSKNGEVEYFGHNPNFRIPIRLAESGENRAANPLDFVPKALKEGTEPDMVEAIFGWVEDKRVAQDKPSLKGQCAGRVFFSDAKYTSNGGSPWLQESPLQLRTLSEPKPTTFQHYLVQDQDKGHDPNKKSTLAHYGSSPANTQIRGYKGYWHKGKNPPIQATPKELERERGRADREKEELLPYVKPVKPGIDFKFTIYFENLRQEELGALLWVLRLPEHPNKTYCHKLGMGKPLGMGAVSIEPQLYLDDRKARYRQLFQDDQWSEESTQPDLDTFIGPFKRFLLEKLEKTVESLSDLKRIEMLLALLQWREGDNSWIERTRYMEIEYDIGNGKTVDEYTDRPVLPDPLSVVQNKK